MTGWGTLPPTSIASTCYAAGGMPLAFKQDDLLVSCMKQPKSLFGGMRCETLLLSFCRWDLDVEWILEEFQKQQLQTVSTTYVGQQNTWKTTQRYRRTYFLRSIVVQEFAWLWKGGGPSKGRWNEWKITWNMASLFGLELGNTINIRSVNS